MAPVSPHVLNLRAAIAPPTNAELDLESLLDSCPAPRSESDFAWEAEREDEVWRIEFAWQAAEEARVNDRLSQECPWLRFDDDEEYDA